MEITDRVELSSWPAGSRVIVRRERPHPGAQLSFTDHDGYRFQAILTDQTDPDIAIIERRHRQRARVEDRIRDDKDTGLAKLPFKAFAMNEVWLEIVMLAHDLIVWTQALVLEGELAKAEPKRLRYRLLHVAARLAFSGRRGKLHLPAAWPWTQALKAAFDTLKALPTPDGLGRPAGATTPRADLRRRDHRCPGPCPSASTSPRTRAPTPATQPHTPNPHPSLHQSRVGSHAQTPTARSGLTCVRCTMRRAAPIHRSANVAAVFDRRQPEIGAAMSTTGEGPALALIEPPCSSSALRRP